MTTVLLLLRAYFVEMLTYSCIPSNPNPLYYSKFIHFSRFRFAPFCLLNNVTNERLFFKLLIKKPLWILKHC